MYCSSQTTSTLWRLNINADGSAAIKHIARIEPGGSSDKLVPAAGHGHAAVAWAGVWKRAETAQTQVREPAITLISHQHSGAKLTSEGQRPSHVQIG